MEKYPAQGGGSKFKSPNGKWYYIKPADVAKYPKTFDCIRGRQTVTQCPGQNRADGPGIDQLHLVRAHKENCQLLVKPEDNDLMKDALKEAALNNNNQNKSLETIYDEIKLK